MKISPKTKEILEIIGIGGLVAASLLAPGLPKAISYFEPRFEPGKEKKVLGKEWKRFNLKYLRRSLRRLCEQKLIEVDESMPVPTLKLTEKGKVRLLKFKLTDLVLSPPKSWDGKWRLIIYDVERGKKKQQDLLRFYLKRLKCLGLQKSVYLTPYPCEEEVEFLRSYFGLTGTVLLLTVEKLENDSIYKEYFGI